MDKALVCHAGGWGQDQGEFFLFGKVKKRSPIPSGTLPCALSLLMAHSYGNSELTCYRGVKGDKRQLQKNPIWTICGVDSQK